MRAMTFFGVLAAMTATVISARAAEPSAGGTGAATAGAAPGAGGLPWLAGAATVKITPAKPIPMAGYASRTKPFERVDHELFAKALALRDAGTGATAVLITVDICILPRDVAEPVRQELTARHKLAAGAVVISLSHTHSGPAVNLAGVDGAGNGVNPSSAAIAEYAKVFQRKLVEAADAAIADLKPATLAWGTGVADFAVNRRQFTDKGVVLGVNPRGPVDRSVPVLRVDGADGKPRAIVFGYACHGTTVPSTSLGLSAEYPGYARDVIEEHFPGATALFVAGCGGDANPYPRQVPPLASRHGRALGAEVCRVADGLPAADGLAGAKLAAVRGPLKVALAPADLPLEALGKEALEEIAARGAGTRKADAEQMLSALAKGERLPAAYRTEVTAWQFGGDLTLVALPCEVVVDYARRVESAVGPMRLWVAAYCHEVEGYIPSERVLAEGGYEARGLYVGTGWFAPGVEDALVGAAREAAVKAGRAGVK